MAKQNKKGIKGRSKDADIERRINLGIKIIKENNYTISRKSFIKKYEEEIMSTRGSTPCPSKSTLYKDIEKRILPNIREAMPNFEFAQNNTISQEALEDKMTPINIRENIYTTLSQIRVSLYGYDYTLFSTKKPLAKNFNQFKKKFIHIKKVFPVKPLYKSAMIHLYFIFSTTGFEKFISSFYKGNLSEKILYTSTHEYCSEIVFEDQNLNDVLKYTYRILKSHLNYY